MFGESQRYLRAVKMTARVMHNIHDVLPGNCDLRAIDDRLMQLFHKSGAYFLDDQDRAELGLEPRDGEGMTPTERSAVRDAHKALLLSRHGPMAISQTEIDRINKAFGQQP